MPKTKKEGEDVLCKGHTFWELPLKIAKFASSKAAPHKLLFLVMTFRNTFHALLDTFDQ
jgi:hypothetical protein